MVKIIETGFSFDSAIISDIPDFDGNKISIEFALKIDLQKTLELIGIDLLVRYKYEGDLKDREILKLQTLNQFSVKDLQDIVEVDENNGFKDKAGIMPTLISISVSSMRGILVVKTAGTVLKDFPLPIFNPVDMCNKLIKT